MPEIVVFWVVCAILGAIIGGRKDASGAGFLLGLIFGPLGVIAAFAMDSRSSCPHCGGRLNGRPQVCQHCQRSIQWASLEDQQADSSYGTRCAGCKVVLHRPVSEVGNAIRCPHCKSNSHVAIFRRIEPLPSLSPPSASKSNHRLTTCPDCDREVSRRAKLCPHCGCELNVG